MKLENQVKLIRAIKVLETEISERTEAIEVLKEALNALHKETDGLADDMITFPQVLQILKISSTTLRRYMAGFVPSIKNKFPQPKTSKGRSPIWKRCDIVVWNTSFKEVV